MSAKGRAAMPYGWGRVPYTHADRRPWMNLPFPVEEYHERLRRLGRLMAREGFQCLVVLGNRADGTNIRYLANFEDFYGGDSLLVVPQEGASGFTTNAVMHGEPMHSGIQDCWIEDVRCAAAPRTVTGGASPATVFDHLEDLITERGCDRASLGVVGEGDGDRVAGFLRDTFPHARVAHAGPLLRELRAIKSPREVEVMRRACHLADEAARAAMEAVRPGITEFELAGEAYRAMFRAGAEHPAFAIGLCAGARAGFKHMAPTAYQVREGDMVYIDVGGRYMGYHSDTSRHRVCGTPSAEQLHFMETQIAIVEEAMGAACPGAVIGDLAELALARARREGYADYLYFRGHGVGAATQDLPAFAPGNPARLEQNMVFAFEPMLVRTGFGTACWEDVWWVTASGVERLNQCPIRWW
ncbi:MAG TPA: Xaa-Pro peptidase family protein [bacterium]|nr:Xaa-Pro peptidase family protein [bacterium]